MKPRSRRPSRKWTPGQGSFSGGRASAMTDILGVIGEATARGEETGLRPDALLAVIEAVIAVAEHGIDAHYCVGVPAAWCEGSTR